MDAATRRSYRRPFLLTVALLAGVGVLSLGACSSGGARSSPAGPARELDPSKAIELRYRSVTQKLTIGLVNESHSSRVETYSTRQPIDRATTKVSPDEVVDAVVEYFRDQGFFGIAVAGSAPATAPQGATQILEVVLPTGPYHAIVRPGVSPQFATTFQTCAKALLQVYSDTMQLQAVDESPSWSGSPRPAPRPKRPGG